VDKQKKPWVRVLQGIAGFLLCTVTASLSWPTLAHAMGPSFEVKQKDILLIVLQAILDNRINHSETPLFQLKLNSPDHKYGTSKLIVNNDEKNVADLDHLEFGGKNIYLQDINISEAKNYHIRAGFDQFDPLTLKLTIPFETYGPVEIKADNGDEVDLTYFKIDLRLELTRQKNGLDLFSFVWEIENALTEGRESVIGPYTAAAPRGGSGITTPAVYYFTTKFRGEEISEVSNESTQSAKEAVRDTLIERFISTDVTADAGLATTWPISLFVDLDGQIKKGFNSRIYDKVKEELHGNTSNPNGITTLLDKNVRKLLDIGEFSFVTSVTSDRDYLHITYIDFSKP